MCCDTIMTWTLCVLFFFFFNDTATTEIYTLSLHDALPICTRSPTFVSSFDSSIRTSWSTFIGATLAFLRSEEHTSELQSQSNLVCRLLLEKKKKNRSDLDMSPYTSTNAVLPLIANSDLVSS